MGEEPLLPLTRQAGVRDYGKERFLPPLAIAPGNQHVVVHKGQRTAVPCAMVPLPPSAIGAAAAGSTIFIGRAAGTAVTAGGVLGGLAGAGAFGGGFNEPASPTY
jgi:hypothetical protein